jgi:hypothetical protein
MSRTPNNFLFLWIFLIFGLTIGGQAETLSGRVYEGEYLSEPPEAEGLSGVSLKLYGSNSSSVLGNEVSSYTTGSDGWYGLETEQNYEFFTIVCEGKSGYSFEGSSSVDGSAWGEQIQYSVPLTDKTLTGNKFWYTSNTPEPPSNNPPVAQDDSATTLHDAAVDIDVLYNDNDPDGDPLHINSVTDPPHGTTINHGTNVTYVPDPGFTGTDTFDYTAGDGKGGTDTATVTVTVEQGQEPPAGSGTIRGVKFNDLNENGRKDPDEPGLSDWKITLTDNDGNVLAFTTTDQNGEYQFFDLEPGTYGVSEEDKQGWFQTFPAEKHYSGVILSQGEVLSDMDFGNHWTGTELPEGAGSIRGMKYNDLNGNGQKDPGEPGLADWTIFLDSNDNGRLDEGEPQKTTDANGNYAFTNMEAGVYRIHEINQTGWRQTDPAVDGVPGYWLIDLEEGREEINIDFGNHREETPEGQEYISDICFNVEIIDPTGTVEKLTLTGPMTQRVYVGPNGEASDTDGNGREEVAAELVSLNLSGVSSFGPITISLNTNTPSIGQIEERVNNTPGILDIPPFTTTGNADSFFDVFFQLQIGGMVLLTPTNQPIRLTSVITHLPPLEGYSDISQTKVELLDQNGQPIGFYFGSVTSCREAPPEGDGGGSVVVVKEATPADDTPFLFCADFRPGGFFDTLCENLKDPSNNTWTFNNPKLLQKVSETVTTGWTLTDITITGDTDNGSTIDLADATVDVDFDEGENIVITFKNEKTGEAQYDFGDAPDSYKTLHNSGGPYHDVGQVMLGSSVDAEPDGQPGPLADADNDDGVSFPLPLVVNQFATVILNVNSPLGVPAAISGWIDFDQSGTFEDPAERIAGGTYTGAGIPVFWSETFIVPATALPGPTYARFRIYRTEPGVDVMPFTGGYGGEGEVEDYRIEIQPGPDMPPSGNLITGIKFNDLNGNAIWEPANGELGLPGWTIWLDTNNDGTPDQTTQTNNQGGFEFTGVSAGTYTIGEQQQSGWTQTSPPAPGTVTFNIPGGPLPTAHFMMFGNRQSGIDYGDAPLPYPEASHQLGGPYLGPFGDLPDPEQGMQRDSQAEGDDNDASGDDENGLLSINLVKTPGVWSTWELKGYFGFSSDAKFGFWIDLNGDGDWDDPNELRAMFGFCGFGPGPQDWFHAMGAFKLPADAKVGTTYARLRVYNDCNAAISPSGAGGPGEVEDYAVEIKADGPGVPPGGIVHGYKWNDVNGNGILNTLNPMEPPLAGWTIWLDINNNGQQDAGDMYEQTDATGHFKFTGVPAGTYILGEQLQPGWVQTTPAGAGIYSVTVQPGLGTFPMMFGNRQSGGPTYDGKICGSKWNDLNGNGILDAAEPMLAGWTIYLDINNNGRWDPGELSQVTDSTGNFEFSCLAIGSYTLAEQMQPGWIQTWPGGAGTHTISILSGPAQPACVMFGNQQAAAGPDLDWGDAPDPNYPTLRAGNGAYHVIVPGIFMGGGVDPDIDGQPAPDARGDDYDGSDDEDGVFFISPIMPGQQAAVEVLVPSAGFLDAWIDFDADGSWNQASDQIFTKELLSSGSNILNFQVPASIAINIDTYARFRFSTAGGLAPDGPAQDGEVEDYHILLGEEGPGVPGEQEMPHVKWSQPPIEIDPNVEVPPVFCGWNESARSTQQSGLRRQWRMDADDFRCIGPVPITRIRWWGGYKAWEHPEPPELQPEAWHIGIWANQVEGLEPDQLYLERLVWSIEVSNERIGREPVGLAQFPEKISETCFLYELKLEPEEWFHQAEFESNDNVFWISITAVYPPGAEAVNQWGWMTRPHIWGGGAVMPAIMGEWPTFDERLFPGRIYPIENSLLCDRNQAYDLCFELLTEQPWTKWDQPFTGIREWPDYTDEMSMAREQDNGQLQTSREVVDDWVCEHPNPITSIVWNGSYIEYGYEACKCEDTSEPLRPDYFLLSIQDNLPGVDAQNDNQPGEKIWEYAAYDYDEVLVGYDRNPEGEPNEPVFRYSVRLPEEIWFRQEGPENIYWLSVIAVYRESVGEIPYSWGWTSHSHLFGSAGMTYEPDKGLWQPLLDSDGKPVDMSFMFLTAPESEPESR